MHHLCQCTPSVVDFSRALDLLRRDILLENKKVTDLHIPIQLVMSIKICINDSCNKIPVRQHLSDPFPIQKVQTTWYSTVLYEVPITTVRAHCKGYFGKGC
jgi:hypothetical protein